MSDFDSRLAHEDPKIQAALRALHRERCKEWRARNPQSTREAAKRWRDAHPKEYKLAQKLWRYFNRERVRAYNKAWRAAHPNYDRDRRRQERAAKKAVTL